MKQLKYIVALMFGACVTTACVDDFKVGDAFLEKAPGVDVNMDTIFSKPEYARDFLWSAYGQLYCTYKLGNQMNQSPIDALSDSYQSFCSWAGTNQAYYTGNLDESAQDTDNGNKQGRFSYSTRQPAGSDGIASNDGDGRVSIYETVRKCWQLIENLERVPGMSEDEQSRLRGEAYIIMASRYFDAFRNFGGLCLVDHAYAMGEDFTTGRSTAYETVCFIDSLIQNAMAEPGLPWSIPDENLGQEAGRLTRAAASALRCKLWMHAASPLFNSSEPYMKYDKAEGTNIEHVWFGDKADHDKLWTKCLECCTSFFNDNGPNGYYQLVKAETNEVNGYRKAFREAYRYRASATNHEKIFDVYPATTLGGGSWGWGHTGFSTDGIRLGAQSPTAELMECFGMADGRVYPYSDGSLFGPGKNPNGIDIFADRDPRLYETIAVPQRSIDVSIVGDYQQHDYVDSWEGGITYSGEGLFNADDAKSGLKRFKWWLDHTGGKLEDRAIGCSYIRLAEIYLIMAEAHAELGHFQDALDALHVVRSRVGLDRLETKNPLLNLRTNKENLINEILRERNCEIGAECGDRFYDMIRRMRKDLFTKPLHTFKTYRLDANGNRMGTNGEDTSFDGVGAWPKFEYDRDEITDNTKRRWWEPGFWTNKWYLDPVSRDEIQKGYGLTQNPGW